MHDPDCRDCRRNCDYLLGKSEFIECEMHRNFTKHSFPGRYAYYECHECGALVEDMRLHTDWHGKHEAMEVKKVLDWLEQKKVKPTEDDQLIEGIEDGN